MTKALLIETVHALPAGRTKREVEIIIDAVFGQIIAALRRGETLRWPGFGTFSVRSRPARKNWNPITRTTTELPARRTVRFSPSAELKQLVGTEVGTKAAE